MLKAFRAGVGLGLGLRVCIGQIHPFNELWKLVTVDN